VIQTPVEFRYRWVILMLAIASQVTLALGPMALGPLAPLFQPEFGLSKTEVGLFATGFAVGSWSLMLVAGSLTDRFGIRAMMSLGQLLSGASLLLMALVGSAFQAVAVMFVVGMGSATALPGSTKSIREWFPPSFRATAMGLKQTGTPAAGILAASLLPALGLAAGWRTALAVLGLVAIASGIATAFVYRDPPGQGRTRGSGESMRSALWAVLGHRSLWVVAFTGLLFTSVQFGLITYLPLYLVDVVFASEIPDEASRVVAAGGLLAVAQMGGLLSRILWGVASDRIFRRQRRTVLGIIGALSALAALAITQLQPGFPAWLISGIAFASGACILGWNGVYHATITEAVSQRYVATAAGLGMTMTMVGMTFGAPLFGLVVDTFGSYQAGWVLIGCQSVVISLLVLATRGTAGARSLEPQPTRLRAQRQKEATR
jgi:MFS transporter, ACS family, hexuronate transporter